MFINNYYYFQVENSLSTYEPHACIVVYSVVARASFQCAEEILNYLWREGYTHEKSVIVVGNKADLARSRVITPNGLSNFCPYMHEVDIIGNCSTYLFMHHSAIKALTFLFYKRQTFFYIFISYFSHFLLCKKKLLQFGKGLFHQISYELYYICIYILMKPKTKQ